MRPILSLHRHLYDGRFPLLNVTRCNARLNHPPNSFLPIDRDDFYDSHGPLTIIKPRYLSFGCCERNATPGENPDTGKKEREAETHLSLYVFKCRREEFTRVSGYAKICIRYALPVWERFAFFDGVRSLSPLRKIKTSQFSRWVSCTKLHNFIHSNCLIYKMKTSSS